MSEPAFSTIGAPIAAVSLADEAERKRLSPVALKAFLRLVGTWKLSTAEAAALLTVSTSTFERTKRRPHGAGVLNQDQLTRISALTGIYKGLHLLFADDMADQWPRLANRGPLFNGATPIEAMVEGGIPIMLDTRRYIDAVRGGL